jgi:hypothetical protein
MLMFQFWISAKRKFKSFHHLINQKQRFKVQLRNQKLILMWRKMNHHLLHPHMKRKRKSWIFIWSCRKSRYESSSFDVTMMKVSILPLLYKKNKDWWFNWETKSWFWSVGRQKKKNKSSFSLTILLDEKKKRE